MNSFKSLSIHLLKKSQRGTCRPGVPLPAFIHPQEPWGERPRLGDVALLGASSPLPATPSFWRERCCPALPVGTGWAWRVGPGLCWRGCREHCPELSEQLRGCLVASGQQCRVLADPPRAGSLTAARGCPSACDLPLKAWFLLSPSISAVRPQSAL